MLEFLIIWKELGAHEGFSRQDQSSSVLILDVASENGTGPLRFLSGPGQW